MVSSVPNSFSVSDGSFIDLVGESLTCLCFYWELKPRDLYGSFDEEKNVSFGKKRWGGVGARAVNMVQKGVVIKVHTC